MNKILLMLLPFHPPLIPPLGIACLKSFLKPHGFDVKTIDAKTQEELRAHYSQYFHILAEYIPLYHQANFHNIEIERDFQVDIPMAIIDPSQIERVFINLIINASEAMDGNGLLNISTRTNEAQDLIEIKVSDNGQGISEENIHKIFDPFFTTKDVGHGTGLGLAISYGIIKSHRGTISVESEVGIGSTFLVRIPVSSNGV